MIPSVSAASAPEVMGMTTFIQIGSGDIRRFYLFIYFSQQAVNLVEQRPQISACVLLRGQENSWARVRD